MKNNYLKLFTIALTVFAVVGMQSCDPDPCSTISCSDNGTCFDGSCLCDAGWTGADCSIEETADPCDGVSCNDNGICVNGDCLCDTGWTGEDCSTPVVATNVRDAILGTWNVSETCSSDPSFTDSYTSDIAADAADDARFYVNNLYNFGSQAGINPQDATVVATITGQTGDSFTFTVPGQTFASNALSNFSIGTTTGSYDADSDRITLSYTLTDNNTSATDDCQQTYTR